MGVSNRVVISVSLKIASRADGFIEIESTCSEFQKAPRCTVRFIVCLVVVAPIVGFFCGKVKMTTACSRASVKSFEFIPITEVDSPFLGVVGVELLFLRVFVRVTHFLGASLLVSDSEVESEPVLESKSGSESEQSVAGAS